MTAGDRSAGPSWAAEAAFVVWSPPYKGTRSAWLAAELGIPEPRYFAPTARRGWLAAPLKYPRQFVATLWFLFRRRPAVVFVQTPPSFAAWAAALYAVMARAALVIDAHSDAFERPFWTKPAWLNSRVARRATMTIVTTSHRARQLEGMGARAVVVPAIPTHLVVGAPPPLSGFNVAVVTTWANDEPVEAVFEAARSCPDVTFHVTGKAPAVERFGGRIAPNVRLTGFLDEPTYNGLLAASDAVMCLTTRDHTMQNGAAEAMYLGTPIITSDWDVLREYFSRGTIHVDNTPAAIAAAVQRMRSEATAMRAEVRSLQDETLHRWQRDRAAILQAVDDDLRAMGRNPGRTG
ncbi:MAG TPA: glycosyltransferase family 4 protein [Candidatus Limnocylindria bacterium]